MSVRAWLAKIIIAASVLTLTFAVTIAAAPFAAAATIVQGPNTTGSIDVAGSAAFTDTLSAPGFAGTTFVVVSQTTPGLTLTGNQIGTTGTLAAATYSIGGTDSDTANDTGTWNYTLTVMPDSISQGSPNSGTTDVVGSSTFTDSLSAASGFIGPVTFTTSTPDFDITNDDVLGPTGTLSASHSPYTVSGGDADAYGDVGTWSYSLTVTPDAIAQGSPTAGSTTDGASSTFTDTLTAASGFEGPVTFVTSTAGFAIAGGDVLESIGSLSASGTPYTITGTDSDSYGDSGTWTYSLTVAATGTKTTNLVQSSPATGAVLNTASSAFTAGPITVQGSTGPVTFVTTKSSTGLTVSASGLISTTGPLTAGTYTVSGTDSDTAGDTGTWTYTLSVTGVPETVTFNANGGGGKMSPESNSAPTALLLNKFTWAKHTFVDWNTSATGSGVSYANGAVFPFGASTTLYAQWKVGKVPSRTITFLSNGGSGRTPSEIDNTPTAISANHFHRAGYSFLGWNTAGNGSGKSFKAGATYSFTKSITLYAQWRKVVVKKPFEVVVFSAHGGVGTMADERDNRPSSLTSTHFRRTGYTFVDWNTVPNGSGTSYANDATYDFAASTTLYAQWKKIKKVAAPPPPVPKGTRIGPFVSGASTLTASLKAQIQSLANDVKVNKVTRIALLGYGDTLTTADEHNLTIWSANIALSRQRAGAVATYLERCLASLKFTGFSISVAAAGATKPQTAQGASSIVIAQLS